VALLGEAQRALEAGQTAAAFAAIAAHDRRFPRAMLGQEAAVIRIEATARSGDRARAQSLSRAFEATYPSSPFRDRLRAIRGDPAP
jgi:outer membrane protein assembly factor BamD (BamD/ComL family)